MKTLKDIFSFILLVLIAIVAIPFFVLFLPILIIITSFDYFHRKKLKIKYAEFLIENDGMNFFCYNNRKKSKEHIEKHIIPYLDEGVQIVYLNGKKLEVENNSGFISSALYGLKNYNKFPHLMKIRNGKLFDISINNRFYNMLNQNRPKKYFLNQINTFFELIPAKSTVLKDNSFNFGTMKRLFEELWLQSNNCTEPIEHIWSSISEVAKSTNNSTEKIKKYVNVLVEEKIIEMVTSEPLLHKFTAIGKKLKSDLDIEKIIKTLPNKFFI